MDHIPRAGAAIIVVNHIGRLEVPLIFPFMKRKDKTEWVALIEGKNGALYSVAKMGTPIIPVAITRTLQANKEWVRFCFLAIKGIHSE